MIHNHKMRNNRRGVSLIEILLGLLIVTIASIATLNYFAQGLGNINKQGNRRAALERARQRLEDLMAVSSILIKPTDINVEHTVTCGAGTCAFSNAVETVPVNDLPTQRIISTVLCQHDAAAGTPSGTCDILGLTAKVWFTPGATDDNFNRVYVRTLRTPL